MNAHQIRDLGTHQTTTQPTKPGSVSDFPPGSPSYVMRELDREPDERLAALKAQWRDLNNQLFESAQRGDPEIEEVRTRLNECGKKLDVILRAPDRVCRLLQLRGNLAFSEWLARLQKAAPIILRYGVPVPPSEQDGYYQKDYEEWRNLGSPRQPTIPGKQDLQLREENGVWHAELTIQTSAIGRSKDLAEHNVRARAEWMAKRTPVELESSEPQSPSTAS